MKYHSNPLLAFGFALTVCSTSIALPPSSAAPVSSATVYGLTCEYQAAPLEISELHPRLSWRMKSTVRGQRQSRYQIEVASSPVALAGGSSDLWRPGIVASDASTFIEYAGKPLISRAQCWWRVRVWDKDGLPTAWSAPAHWTMGLLNSSDWTAKWIEGAPADAGLDTIVVQSAFYETTDRSASVDVTAKVSAIIKTNAATTVENSTFGGDPKPNVPKRLRIELTRNGVPAELLVPEHEAIYQSPAPQNPYLRKPFKITKGVASATLYITALGLYEARINGQRIGDHVLAPEWTDYAKRVVYQAYDVAPLLHKGDNAIGAILSNGWYAGHLGNGGFQQYGVRPALLAQLEITYSDGSKATVVSDASWKYHVGAVVKSDFMFGEVHDAKREQAGWDTSAFDDRDWAPVALRSVPPISLDAQVSPPVRQTGAITPKSFSETAPGKWTFDLGQNMVGIVRIAVSGKAGQTITIRHAEMLNKGGTIYTDNLRGASSVDTYTCRGEGVETWQPKFTFHGFRYVEVSGLTSKPTASTVTGIVLGSDTSRTGSFACSDPRINQLMSNIQWGQRGNYLSVPTDCPQRDERLGWMGDAQVFVRTATMNADVASFYTKWLVDVDDAQLPDGRFTNVSPFRGSKSGTPGWGDAGVICPWTIYSAYGDKRLLQRHLPAMSRWVEWCREHSTNLLRDHDLGSNYGDWLAIGSDTPRDVIGTAYFAYSTSLLARSYAAVGDAANAKKYNELFGQIRDAFNTAYVTQDGHIKGDTQCAYAMALQFGLVPDSLRAAFAANLHKDIEAKGWHLSTGFVGVSYLLPALTAAGDADTAYRLIEQDTFPSWLFSVKHGATTIWERWDGWTPDKGFQNPGMNSFNHYSLGSCGEWLYDSVAGIGWDDRSPGYKHILLRPTPGPGLTNAHATLDTAYGKVACGWEVTGSVITVDATVPPNATATLTLPAKTARDIKESGQPISAAKGVRVLNGTSGSVTCELESGTYRFVIPGYEASRLSSCLAPSLVE